MIPSEYGRYKILSEIGEGGMAKVFLAEDPTLNRLVAVKVIHTHLSSNQAIQKRFAAEAKIAAALKSPHIVEIYDYGIQKGSQYFIMEYIEGFSLDYICSKFNNKGLPERFCAAAISQAAEGLIIAEKHNVVHRDIKPANLVFNFDGILKIADFGIAKLGSLDTMTKSGALMGTPHFISPEQYDNAPPTTQSDIWALGVIFYYCLTGLMPFSGDSVSELMTNVCTKEHPSVMEIDPDIDPELSGIIDILLRKDPEKRGQGAEWLARKLRQFLGKNGLFNPEEGTKMFIQHLELPSRKGDSKNPITSLLAKFQQTQGNQSNKTWDGVKKVLYKPWTWLVIFLIFLLPFLRGAFTPTEKVVPIQSVQIYPKDLVLQKGEKMQLRAVVEPYQALKSVQWETNMPHILSVTNGMVYANDTGNANVLAVSVTNPAKVGTCYVKVQVPFVSLVVLEPSRLELKIGDKSKLTVKVEPLSASQKVRWKVKPKGIISLKNRVVTAKQSGIATVSVISMENSNIQATCDIIVRSKPGRSSPPRQKKSQTNTSEQNLGYLKITSAPPHASIRVNGNSWGKTPMFSFKSLKPGSAKVEVFHRSFPPRDTIIRVTRKQKVFLRFKLD